MAYVAPSIRATGEVITASVWNQDVVNNMIAVNALARNDVLDYVEFTSPVTLTTTSFVALASGNAITYDGSTPITLEFFAPVVDITGSQGVTFELGFDGTSLSQLGAVQSLHSGVTYLDGQWPVALSRRLTPAAGSHSFYVAAALIGGTSAIVQAGTGSGFVPGYFKTKLG